MSIVDCVQEMGCCGQRVGIDGDFHDQYVLMLNLNDFIYLNEWLYGADNKDVDNSTRAIPFDIDRNNQCLQLLHLLCVFVLNNQCIHYIFKTSCSNPLI